MRFLFLFGALLVAAITIAQTQKPSGVADFISIDAPVFVLDHVRVIDGTGAPPKEEQAVAIANGKIQFIGPEASARILRARNELSVLAIPSSPVSLECITISTTPIPTPCKLSAERLASRDCSLRRFLTRRRDSIWRLA
jgi:hypothetical protein